MDFSYIESIARNTVSFLAAHWEALLPIVGVYVAWRTAKWGVRQAGKGIAFAGKGALWALSNVVPPRLPLVALAMILGGGSAAGWGISDVVLESPMNPQIAGMLVGGGFPSLLCGVAMMVGWLNANAPECFVRNKRVYNATIEAQIDKIKEGS